MNSSSWLVKIFLSIIALAIVLGAVQTVQELATLSAKRKAHPFSFAGTMFEGARNIIKDEKYVRLYHGQKYGD